MENHRTFLGIRRAAWLETALFLALALLLDRLLGTGNRFFDIHPHPFWIIVLLVSCQYGTAEGLMAAVLSTLALLLFNMPPQALNQNMYDYLYAVTKAPLLWVIAAVCLGELRYRHVRERAELQDALMSARQREEKIAQSYQWVRDGKEKLETRIAGQLRSSVAATQAARAMEALSPEQIISGLEALVDAVLSPPRFSIYLLDETGLSLALSHGWEGITYQSHFAADTALYQAIIQQRQVLCVANVTHEPILAGQGVLAGALISSETGEAFGMLKVEELGFSDLHLSSIETFASVCEWAGLALGNARKYQTAKSESMVNPDHRLFTANYFTRYADYITALAKRVGFDVTMVVAKLGNAATLNQDTRNTVARALADAVDSVLRAVDLAFDYQGNAEQFSIVLPTTDRRGAEVVAQKIRIALAERLKDSVKNADVTFSLQTLHQK